ncbi:hypothetical protein AB0E69_30055 [Kribbella sp. NPDC026611]|uniref:hypothetical protein n=1 Tax=Kribbella sp. NPDC026611 TaxID=3154911 RepID=UPI00340567A0
MRIGAAAGLAVIALVSAPAVAHATTSAQVTQPYTHLLTGKTWSTGGAYVSTGGDVKLKLTTLPKATQVLIEDCESGEDLGDVKDFTRKAPAQTLAVDVPKGTCFLMLLQPKAGSGGYQVAGFFSY